MNARIRFYASVRDKRDIVAQRDRMLRPDLHAYTIPFDHAWDSSNGYGWLQYVRASLYCHSVVPDTVPTELLRSMYDANCTVQQAVETIVRLADVE